MLLLLVSALKADAQTSRAVYQLSGVILAANSRPLTAVTVTMRQSHQTEVARQALTDTSGNFIFDRMPAGNYVLTASLIGYQKFSIAVLIGPEDLRLPVIHLQQTVVTLKEVAVTSKKQMIEIAGGKLTFNVDQSAAAAGSSAFELLRRTPGVNVDQNENLLFKGSGNINLLIDGKMTYMSNQQLTNMLKGMSADQISRIEVSGTPSAQFDASGNAGMINIITKRSSKPGYAATIATGVSVGHYVVPNENVSVNLKTSKLNLFAVFGYSPYHTLTHRSNINTQLINGSPIVFDRELAQPIQSNYYTFKGGFDYALSPENTIGFSYTGSLDNWSKDASGTTYLKDGSGNTVSTINNRSVAVEPYHNNAFNLNYKLKLDTSGAAISTDADYVTYSNQSDGFLGNQQFDVPSSQTEPYQELRFHQPSYIHIKSLKGDLDLPTKKIVLKAGLKFAEIESNNNFRYDSLKNTSYELAPSLSDHFVYQERISAAYVSLSKHWTNSRAEIGLRAEHTFSKGEAITIDSIISRSYTDIFPTFSLDHKINDDNNISFSVSRRINRPNYSILNPVRFFSDKYAYFSGSPNLLPEKAWVGEITYTLKDKYIATLSYNRLSDFIGQIIHVDPQTSILISQNANFPHRDRLEGLFVIPFQVTPIWSVNTTTNLSYTAYPISQRTGFFTAKRVNVNLLINQVFALPTGYTFELNGTYTSGELNGIYLTHYYYQVDVGVKKSFLNKKLDVRFSFTDLFQTNRYWGSSISNAIDYTYKYLPLSRKFNLTLLYRIGGKLVPGKVHRIEEQDRL